MDKLIDLIKETKRIAADGAAAREITVKGLADFVTRVDTGIQEFLRTRLAELYPDIQFMSEEKDNSGIDLSGRVWILDPIDGTTNLIHDYKMSAVSLALAEGGTPTLGIVYNPFTEELFSAKKGCGAFLNGAPIRATDTDTLSGALVSVGTSPYRKAMADKNFETIKKFFVECEDIRRSGSAALDLCYIACGRTDGYFERNLKPWDHAAGTVILREAGGTVTTMSGGAPVYTAPDDICASNGRIHEKMIEIINNG